MVKRKNPRGRRAGPQRRRGHGEKPDAEATRGNGAKCGFGSLEYSEEKSETA
jgi:hypothetical protein